MAANRDHSEHLADAALAALSYGLCPIPIRDDGSKAPYAKWKQYQYRMPTEAEVSRWFASGRDGLALLGGAISGNLEILDFDEVGLFHRFAQRCQEAGLGELLAGVGNGYTERTPRGGHHLIYRIDGGPAPGNTKLAQRPATAEELAVKPDEKVKTLIETRGEGGYAIVAPTNGWVHPTGQPWQLLRGGFDTIATISREERDQLIAVARRLDQMPPEGLRDLSTASGDRPGDLYDVLPDAHDRTLVLLLEAGWQEVGREGRKVYLTRPGKNPREGKSATLGHHHPGHLYVFTPNAPPFEAERNYSPFKVLAFLKHGGDFTAAAREARATVDGTEVPPTRAGASSQSEAADTGLILIPWTDVTPERVGFLWADRIPLGGVTVIVGVGGLGKSVLACQLSAQATRGTLPGDLGEPCNVVFASAEDGRKQVLIPRLIAAGANFDRGHFIAVNRDGHEDGLNLPDDIDHIRHAIVATGARLVIIDPLVAYIVSTVDSHKDHHIRRVLAPLHRLAEEFNVAIVGIAHLNKMRSSDLYERISGSAGLFNAARSVLLMTGDPKAPRDPEARVIVHGKANWAKLAVTLRVGIEGRDVIAPDGPMPTAGLAWRGEDPGITVGDALNRSGDAGDDGGMLGEAKEWLRAFLADGPKPRKEVMKAATANAFSETTIKRAAQDLEVLSDIGGFPATATWSLSVAWKPDGWDDSPDSTVGPTVGPNARAGPTGDLGPTGATDSSGQTSFDDAEGVNGAEDREVNGGAQSCQMCGKSYASLEALCDHIDQETGECKP